MHTFLSKAVVMWPQKCHLKQNSIKQTACYRRKKGARVIQSESLAANLMCYRKKKQD